MVCRLAAAPPIGAQTTAAELTGVVVGPGGAGTLVTLSHTGTTTVKAFQLSGPPRVVIDLQGLQHGLPQTDFGGVAGSGIGAIRTSQFDATTVRVVLDLDRAVRYSVERKGGRVEISLATRAAAFTPWSAARTAPLAVPDTRIASLPTPSVTLGAAEAQAPKGPGVTPLPMVVPRADSSSAADSTVSDDTVVRETAEELQTDSAAVVAEAARADSTAVAADSVSSTEAARAREPDSPPVTTDPPDTMPTTTAVSERVSANRRAGGAAPRRARPDTAAAGVSEPEAKAARAVSGAAARTEQSVVSGAALPTPSGQDVVITTVTRIAGATLYIDRGSESGVLMQDTLRLIAVEDDERGGPQLRVLASAEGRAVLEFIGAPVQITRGDKLSLVHATPARADETLLDIYSRAFPNGAAPAGTRAEVVRAGPQSAGRLLIDLNAIQSTTKWSDSVESGSVSRTFLTPTARFIGSVTNLPGGFRLESNLRGSYRYATGGVSLSNQQSLRVYELSLDRSTEGLQVRLGRFYSPYESFSGYWDGGVVRVGSDDLGAGILLGFQPDAWNESFSVDIPKMSLFVDLERRSQNGGFRADWSAHRLMPRNGLETHTFLGWSQRLWWKRLTVSNELQLDQNSVEGGWVVSEFQTNTSMSLGARTQVYARVSRRQPYYYWVAEDPFSYLRDGAGLGMTVAVSDAVVGGDVTFNHSELRGTLRAFSGSLQLPAMAGGWSSSTYATWWSDKYSSGASLSPTFSRAFGDVNARMGYRYYWSESAFNTLGTHGFDGTLIFPAGPGLRATLQASGQWGGNLRNLRLYSSLWKTF
ncbi:MAG: AMIN domain-containing protein [Gemmatimonadota bacterium]